MKIKVGFISFPSQTFLNNILSKLPMKEAFQYPSTLCDKKCEGYLCFSSLKSVQF